MAEPSRSPVSVPSYLPGQLDGRDVALWLGSAEGGEDDAEKLVLLCRMPWSVVVSEWSDERFLSRLEAPEALDSPLVLRRGLVYIIDTDPSDTILPPRHLAVLLFRGRGAQRQTGIAANARRFTMLQELRKRPVKHLIVAIPGAFAVPADLGELWADGFRTALTFVSSDPRAAELVSAWRREHSVPLVDIVDCSPSAFAERLEADYLHAREGAIVCRIRNEGRGFRTFDATKLDDPERPVLGTYELIGNDVLTPLLPSDLAAAEVDTFFTDTTASWRPYAAGMVWERDPRAWEHVRSRLRLLDKRGAEENRILYIVAESGAGATAFTRDLAWRAAAEGYPTLVAGQGPTRTNGLEMANFLTRLINTGRADAEDARLYEVPCLLVYDQGHWDGRDPELLSFAREIERSGRRVCMLVVTGPYVSLGMQGERRFSRLANLTHEVPKEHALALGRHLNRFLAPHGTERSEREWRDFYASSSVNDDQGIAAFWIVLSFWLQRQLELGETVQSRVYRQFKEHVHDEDLRVAIVRIAAFSTMRTPLPEALLPDSPNWPVSDKLEDARKVVGALSLLRVRQDLYRAWAMAHDLLGRYLLTALFYDTEVKRSLGLERAVNPEHLRFLVLKQISELPCLGRADLREVADAFAISIFKVDPDHGRGSLAPYWREVLEALDEMPRPLRLTSRSFLHHGAISRRRIASDRMLFIMSEDERVALLRRAIDDLKVALRLDAPAGGESDLNLYNSLAHALLDLAEAELAAGLDLSVIEATRTEAQAATKRAYALNPDNSFVVETYARTLLSEGKADGQLAVVNALEVLTLAYGLMARPGSKHRKVPLGRLAERAFKLLLETGGADEADPNSETGAIAVALASLGRGVGRIEEASLAELPKENREAAVRLLAAEPIVGNVQAVKLRYMLTVLDRPLDFAIQLELLQSLQGSGPAFTPQMEVEFATLLFQEGRSYEGDKVFRRLRSLWRRGEHFVDVPSRLRWLLDGERVDRRQVRARVSANADGRAMARVTDFQNIEVPFRATEFAAARPQAVLTCFVSFGHNGPLLRPLTALRR